MDYIHYVGWHADLEILTFYEQFTQALHKHFLYKCIF